MTEDIIDNLSKRLTLHIARNPDCTLMEPERIARIVVGCWVDPLRRITDGR